MDDTIKANAEFHYKARLSPKIIRTSDGNCCDWCDGVVGEYKYPDVPKDVYRRHKNCGCEVNYYPGDGKYQNAHTKKWSDLSNFLDEESKYENEGNNKLKYLSYYFARELGLNPLTEEQAIKELRKQSREWIKSLTHDEVNAINKYTYNGKDSDGLRFFEKINGYLGGYYTPKDEKELKIIARNANHIRNALLKFELSSDIIVYRKDNFLSLLDGSTQKFISTSINPSSALTGNPNVAIIIPKGQVGAYVENLSHDKFKNQLEFIINHNVPIKEVYREFNMKILIVGGSLDEEKE